MSYAYTVTCRFDSLEVAQRWQDWMQQEHFADLLRAGAQRAELVVLEPEILECRYLFADAAAFERYERDSGPALRQRGLALFPLELGLHYSRRQGAVVLSMAADPSARQAP